MKHKDYSTRRKKYVHLNERDRYKLEGLLRGKKNFKEIARIMRRDRSTIYREIKRGMVVRIINDFLEDGVYRANVAQKDYERKGQNKERSLKIGKDKELESYIRIKITEDKYSPDAVIGEIKARRLKFRNMICTKTLYNYIDAGYLTGISNESLWEKRKKKRRYKKVYRTSVKNRDSRSIEDRPKRVEERLEYGHWEGDTVRGPQGSKAVLFTLSERMSKEQMIFKLEDATQEGIQAQLDGLEKKYKAKFALKFKSITFDNGSEFLGWKTLEASILRPGKRRTTIYFAHSYSSWERGTNENQNRMIRRFIPKGKDIAEYSRTDIQQIQDWMNNYPRKILGYKTATQVAQKSLQNDNFRSN